MINNPNIINVFAVYGDSCNIGIGTLIGIFERENDACKAAIGRGEYDVTATDYGRKTGTVIPKKAIKINDEIYLLELEYPVKLNTILREPPNPLEDLSFGIRVVNIKDPINFMRVIRKNTGMSLREAKTVVDNYNKYGKAKIEPFHDNLDSTVTKDQFQKWKQEIELNNYAEIEAT